MESLTLKKHGVELGRSELARSSLLKSTQSMSLTGDLAIKFTTRDFCDSYSSQRANSVATQFWSIFRQIEIRYRPKPGLGYRMQKVGHIFQTSFHQKN